MNVSIILLGCSAFLLFIAYQALRRGRTYWGLSIITKLGYPIDKDKELVDPQLGKAGGKIALIVGIFFLVLFFLSVYISWGS